MTLIHLHSRILRDVQFLAAGLTWFVAAGCSSGAGLDDASTASGGTGGAQVGSGGSSGNAGSCVGSACGGAAPSDGRVCGDGIVGSEEACDDGNAASGDGCTGNCRQVEEQFVCTEAGQACLSTVECGDGKVGGDEQCDDGNSEPRDGCDDTCRLQAGWVCPVVGGACHAAQCGDGMIAGNEECDDGNARRFDGCGATCKVENGWVCETAGQACRPSKCGDRVRESTEGCDDANNDLGDGCTPLCRLEPSCGADGCTSVCGDGLVLGEEQCDDGNTRSGDGCSATCTREAGYSCDRLPLGLWFRAPVVYRDFKGSHVGGHPNFEPGDAHPDAVVEGIVDAALGLDGKPLFSEAVPDGAFLTNQADFETWYTDSETSRTVADWLMLTRATVNADFEFASSAFFPLDGRGWQDPSLPIAQRELSQRAADTSEHNFYFTTEVRYWFEYQAGQELTFSGDDDIWVFVNRQLVVDLGGIHGAQTRSMVLENLSAGTLYEVAIFHAERHVPGSTLVLTLPAFDAGPSLCRGVCGDGIVTRDEVCDDTDNDGSYAGCMPGCKARAPFCGNGKLEDGEQCDDGINLSRYGGCAPGCVNGPYCGDARVQSGFEECDDGINDGTYGGCGEDCTLAPRCGDGVLQAALGEECDDANRRSGDGCDGSCQNELIR